MSVLDTLFGAAGGDDFVDRQRGAFASDLGAQRAAFTKDLSAELERATSAAAWKLGVAGVVVVLVAAAAALVVRRSA